MDIEIINKLLLIKKKSEASKADKKSFHDNWLAYVETYGFDDSAESFLYEGFTFMGIIPFISYLEKVSDKNEAIKRLLGGKSFFQNNSITFKLMLHLLAMLVVKWPSELTLISMVIDKLPSLSVNKENKLLGDISKSVSKYFIQEIMPELSWPPMEALNSKNLKWFCSIMNKALGDLIKDGHCSDSELATMRKIEEWLRAKSTTDSTMVSDLASGETPVALSGDIQDISNIPVKTENHSSQIEKKIPTWRDNINTLFTSAKSLEKRLIRLYDENTELLRENDRFRTERDNARADLKSEQKNSDSLKAEISRLAGEVYSLSQKLDVLENKISEKEAKIAEYGQLTDMLDNDRVKQGEQALNRLASKLRVDYRDFLSSTNMPMTAELGEIMRFQLNSLFELLKRNGLNLE